MDMDQMRLLMRRFLSYGDGAAVPDYYFEDDSSDYSDSPASRLAEANSEKIAQDLISEEEKEKRKAEKRRAKKKKRKEKKRLEKEMENAAAAAVNSPDNSSHNSHNNGTRRSSDEGEGIDPNAAFVRISKKKMPDQASATKTEHISNATDKNDRGRSVVDNSIILSKGKKGNLSAQNGDYPSAIDLFSEAIKLEPSDFRFYGNRSYCYDRIMQYDKALADAERCIELSPDWPKGYFRKGRALAGLKLFHDAEKSFVQVLKLDKNCDEAQKELVRVRTQYLVDMGFPPRDAQIAVLRTSNLSQALESLLAGVGAADVSIPADAVFVSDDDEDIQHTAESVQHNGRHSATSAAAASPKATDQQLAAAAAKLKVRATANSISETFQEEKKMDPTNPDGLTALWVGNVIPSVSEADLRKLFSKYGQVSSVRCLPEKYCAFVNFKSKEMAGKAMNALQNHEVQGQNLLIKFPDNPIANGTGKTQVTAAVIVQPRVDKKPVSTIKPAAGSKTSGPVNDGECYFWRTTGCQFGDQCRHKHVKEHQGVDRKPWQRVK